MRCQRSAPEATQASGDDEILLGLRQRTERCPWLAALKQHGTEIIVSVESRTVGSPCMSGNARKSSPFFGAHQTR